MKQRSDTFLTSSWGVALGACIACALWGSAAPAIKTGYRLFGIPSEAVSTQILFAGIRFSMAGIFTILFASLLAKKPAVPKRTSWGMVATLSAFQTVIQYLFYYIGLAHTSGVKASIITGSQVFIAILMACFLFRQERMTSKKLIGCILGFSGVVLVNISGGSLGGGLSLKGEGCILMSACSYSVSSVLTKTYSARENPLILSGWQFALGGAVMAAFGLLSGGSLPEVSLPALGILLYLSLLSTVAYALWAVLLKYNPVSRVAVYGFMNPVFGVIFSALLLGEGGGLGLKALGALLLVCMGIFVVNFGGSPGKVKGI